MTTYNESEQQFAEIKAHIARLEQDIHQRIFNTQDPQAIGKIGLGSGLGRGWLLGAPGLTVGAEAIKYETELDAEIKLAEEVIPTHYQFIKREDDFWGLSQQAAVVDRITPALSNTTQQQPKKPNVDLQKYVGLTTLSIGGLFAGIYLLPTIGVNVGVLVSGVLGAAAGLGLGVGITALSQTKKQQPAAINAAVNKDYSFEIPEEYLPALLSLPVDFGRQLTAHFEHRAKDIRTAINHAHAINNQQAESMIANHLDQLADDWQQIWATAANPDDFRAGIEQYLDRQYQIEREEFLNAARSMKREQYLPSTKRNNLLFAKKSAALPEYLPEQDMLQELHNLKSAVLKFKPS